MKKWIVITAILMMSVVLMACSSEEITKGSFSQESINIEMEITSEDDVVNRLVQRSVMDLEPFDEAQREQVRELVKSAAAQFEVVEGVSYNTTDEANKLEELVEINITEENFATLKERGIIPLDNAQADFISLKATKDNLKQTGWVFEGDED